LYPTQASFFLVDHTNKITVIWLTKYNHKKKKKKKKKHCKMIKQKLQIIFFVIKDFKSISLKTKKDFPEVFSILHTTYVHNIYN
jgi:hypothetical protein